MLWNLKYLYTTDNLAELRLKYNLPICHRETYSFLKGQKIISKNLSNRIVIHSNFIQSYKQLRRYYIARIKEIFLMPTYRNKNLYNFKEFYKDISYFFKVYCRSRSLNCLDRALVWRAAQINSIFKITFSEKKKKKKYIYKSRVNFVNPHKRILMVWRWLNVFIRSFVVKNKNWNLSLGPSIENFLMSYPTTHILTDYKLQIYKIKLLRTL